jgi:hypothetical protein
MAAAKPNARVLGISANETGKSFAVAALCSWHYDCFYPSLTITTAPAAPQVEGIIFRELRRLRRNDPDFAPKAPKLSADIDRICIGYTAKDANSFQGRHDASVLVVFDEADGIEPEIWNAARSFATRWVCMYNPITGQSQASREEKLDTWTKVHMSAFNHPNIAAELAGLPIPVPNAVNVVKLKDRLAAWAKKVPADDVRKENDIEFDGEWWRLGPLAQARLLGCRPKSSINTIFSEETWKKVDNTRLKLSKDSLPCIGCDVARFGDDFTTIHVRRGGVSIHHEAHNGWNTTDTSRRLRILADKFHPGSSNLVPIVIDDVGVGGGVVDQMTGLNVYPLIAQAKSDLPDDYPDVRSQMHFQFEEWCCAGLVDLSRIDRHDIEEQLNAVRYELTNKGQRVVWSKKKVKEELGRSPDDADAVLLAYYQPPNMSEVYE